MLTTVGEEFISATCARVATYASCILTTNTIRWETVLPSFKRLERDKEGIALHSHDTGNQMTGRLRLDGKRTIADVDSDRMLGRQTSEEGWFDIAFESQGHGRVVLHRALLVRDVSFHSIGEPLARKVRQHIFPNVVVLNSDRSSSPLQVSHISFRLRNLDCFFWYDLVDLHMVRETDAAREAMVALRVASARQEHYPRAVDDYEFSEPDDVYIVHGSVEPVRFSIGPSTYSIFVGRSDRGGRKNIDVRHTPIPHIEFDEPVGIDDALEFVEAWQRFFSQMAFKRMPMRSASFVSSRDEEARWSELYLPSERAGLRRGRRDRNLSAHDIPLNKWSEREKMRDLMREWLNHEEQRHRFRIFVDYVLRSDAGGQFDHLVTLCAAIESLPGLVTGANSKTALLDAVSKAASEAADEVGLEVSDVRMRGLIGQLGAVSLRDRILKMISVAMPETPLNQITALVHHVSRLRRIAAHGDTGASLRQPMLGATTYSLLALCILYDLHTSGLDLQAGEFQSTLKARQTYLHCMANLVVP